jgi:hypothetical protein
VEAAVMCLAAGSGGNGGRMARRQLDQGVKGGKSSRLSPTLVAHPHFALRRRPGSPPCGLGAAWVHRMGNWPASDENYFFGGRGRGAGKKLAADTPIQLRVAFYGMHFKFTRCARLQTFGFMGPMG